MFQALDLALFGALQKSKATAVGEFGYEPVNEQITKLAQAHEQSASSMTIRASFRRAGLTANTRSRLFRLVFDEERLREKPGFKFQSMTFSNDSRACGSFLLLVVTIPEQDLSI
jgi:hypothetical protein